MTTEMELNEQVTETIENVVDTTVTAPTTNETSSVKHTKSTNNASVVFVDNEAAAAWQQAKTTPWLVVKQLFDEDISKYISAAQSAVSSEDWSDLVEIAIPVTVNENNGKYCCWECGGAKQSSGHALLIGEPSGSKPLAMSAFRRYGVPNGKQAVIQIYPSCVLVLATQSRGMGVVLVYRVASLATQNSIYVQTYNKSRKIDVTEGEPVTHFVMKCQLNKVFNMANHETRQFSNDLNDINVDSDIVQTAIRKATIYNCEQALYIRPFFRLKDGEEDWNIDELSIENTYTQHDRICSFLTETLALFSNLIRKMEAHTFPYLGIKAESVLDKENESDPDTILVKVAIFTNKASHAWNIHLTEKIFNQFKDYFMYNSWAKMLAVAKDTTGFYKKSYVCKYAGN